MTNVLLVTVDSLRRDRTVDGRMPFTRSLADNAIEFSTCVANGPSTPASFPAIHASQHFASIDGLGLPSDGDTVTLAEHLAEAGYETACFTDNHFVSSEYNFDRGFNTVHDASGISEAGRIKQFVQSSLDKDGRVFKIIESLYNRVDSMTTNGPEYERAASLNERALSWIDDRPDGQDWFVWLHYMDPHHPYEPSTDYQQRQFGNTVSLSRCRKLSRRATHHPQSVTDDEWALLADLYNAECAYVDDQFESLLAALERRSVRTDTTVVFTADHGELLGEHGKGGHPPEFWEEVVRVPLVIDGPAGGVSGSDEVSGQVRLLDIAPTVADAVGIEPTDRWEGESALEIVRGHVDSRQHAYGDVGRDVDYRRTFVRRSDGWKLMRIDRGEFLFDTTATPAEQLDDNQFGEGHPAESELATALNDHRREMKARRTGQTAIEEDSEMVTEHLRELGYLE